MTTLGPVTMLEINITEGLILSIWLIGIVAAVASLGIIKDVRKSITILVVAVLVPVVGSIISLIFLATLRMKPHGDLSDRGLST